MTTIEDVLDKADSYADGPHFHGYFGTRREVLRAAIEQYAAERVVDALMAALRDALATPCGCRIGECESKPDRLCRMTVEIREPQNG